MSKTNPSNSTKVQLEIKPVTARIGAEVTGIRLSADLNTSEVLAIREALLKYKVLFFRDQQHLDDAGQEAFSRLFGELYAHPTVPSKDGTSILELDSTHGGRADAWHTDVTFVDAYPKASILRSVIIPEVGGDTIWANTATAYRNLSKELRNLVDQRWALHTNDYDYAAYHTQASSEDYRYYKDVFTSTIYETKHPLVRVHPETGERTLVLGQFVKRILGLSLSDSNHLLSVLQDHITKPENTVRWRWAVGDVVIWDNRATQHYAVNDYGDQHRVVRRVTLAGDVPVSVDGQRSVTQTKVKVVSDKA
ncbi:TauD/TfdA dioxygenase family protein [Bacillus sp. OTU530]|uniref:TauD/TfdA dioxygenase family protein n=1 Tax=Bacillus sp. OTU530 TaxID=3043862 RepID=UPI00313C3B51